MNEKFSLDCSKIHFVAEHSARLVLFYFDGVVLFPRIVSLGWEYLRG